MSDLFDNHVLPVDLQLCIFLSGAFDDYESREEFVILRENEVRARVLKFFNHLKHRELFRLHLSIDAFSISFVHNCNEEIIENEISNDHHDDVKDPSKNLIIDISFFNQILSVTFAKSLSKGKQEQRKPVHVIVGLSNRLNHCINHNCEGPYNQEEIGIKYGQFH